MQWTEPMFRPPQEARSILLRGSQGCTHNRCHFCYISRESAFGVASPGQIEEELQKLKGRNMGNAHVYLCGSNPFCQSFERLEAVARVIGKYLPGCPEISMHTRITDIEGKTLDELKALRAMGITHLYPGTENGSDEALTLMNKGANARQAEEQLHRLDEAGIAYTLNYIVGMGGKGQGERCGLQTALLFSKVRPRRITTTGLTVFPNTPLFDMVRNGTFQEATEREKIEETIVFVENLQVDTILDCRHYLNFATFKAELPREKSAVLDELSSFLEQYSEEEIAAGYRRECFRTL